VDSVDPVLLLRKELSRRSEPNAWNPAIALVFLGRSESRAEHTTKLRSIWRTVVRSEASLIASEWSSLGGIVDKLLTPLGRNRTRWEPKP
jgi:hypothetical protein